MSEPTTITLRRQSFSSYVDEHAATDPDHRAIIFYDTVLTYGWLSRASDILAAHLAEQGVRPGEVVALYLQNCPQFIIAYLAAQKVGATVSPCNPMLKTAELEYQLADLEAAVLITSADLLPQFSAIAHSSVRHTLIADPRSLAGNSGDYAHVFPGDAVPDGATVLEDIIGNACAEDAATARDRLSTPELDCAADVALIIYTSGTSGLPKGAMLSYQNCEHKALSVAATYRYTSADTVTAVMPIFHVAGMLVGMSAALVAGSTILLFSRFEPSDVLTAINRHQASVSYTTPPMNSAIIACATEHGTRIDSLRVCLGTSFGRQITQKVSEEWKELSGQEYFEFAYGMSETHTADTLMPPDDIVWGSTGKPTFNTSIRITDPHDRSREVPIGELGEISVSSPAVFLGYKGLPEVTEQAKVDGWYYSGDMGRLNEDGYLFFDGRLKEMIKCSGYSVFPEEVEKYLQQHPAVRQAAVIGVPDDIRGESVRAFIVLDDAAGPDITAEQLIDWARQNMAAYKYPRSIVFIDEIPQTPTGKMLRAKLKETSN